jgi:hypothetical protein
VTRVAAVVAIAICLLICLPVGSSAEPPSIPAGLAPMSWLVGNWRGEEPNPDGSTTVVEIHIQPAPNAQALLYDVWFTHAGARSAQYVGMYVWHPARSEITLWQVNPRGEVGEGVVTSEGSKLVQVLHVTHPDGTAHDIRASYTRRDNGAFTFDAEFRTSASAAWQHAITLTYRRVVEAPL